MIDYYLSAQDETTMRTALIAVGVTDDEGSPAEGCSLDVIGQWYEQPEDPDAEPVPVLGWHVNVRSVEPVEWPESVTQHDPRTPWRVYG